MKTAILLIGNVRTWEFCKDNFKEVFSGLKPDIYVSTYNLQYNHHPVIKNRIGDFSDFILEEKHIKKMFRDFNVKEFDIEDGEKPFDMTDVNDNFKNLETCFGQYKRLQRATEMLSASSIEYDCVIKTRCDLIHEPINFVDLSKTIIIDSGNVFPNDCVFVTNHQSMLKMSNFMMNEFYNPKYEDSHLNPPHGLLNNAIKEDCLEINVQKIMNCVIRKDGKKYFY